MSYHRGGHAGAVAVSYGTSSMAPLSPSRRYSSGSTGTNTSGIGSSTSKFNTYRSSGTSILDRPSNYYSSSSRSSYLSEYRRSFCSPARSVSSAYSDAGTGSAYSSSIRFSPSASSSSSSSISSKERSETRDSLGSLATSAADIIAKYSPSGYVPNIHSNAHFTSIYGGNAADARNSARDRDREPPADLGSPSAPPSGTVGTISGSRASRIPWRPPLGTLLANHALPDSSPSSTEVTTIDARNNNSNDSCCSSSNINHNNSNCEINRDRQPADATLPANRPSLIISAAVVNPNPKCTNLTNPSNNAVLTNNNDHDSKALEDHGGRGATSNERSGPDTIVRARDNLVNQRTEDRGEAPPPPPPPPPPPLPSSFLSSSSASSYSTNSSSWEPSSEAANGSPPIVPSSVESERSSSTRSRNTGDSTTPGASTSRRTDVISTENASASDDASPSSSAAASHRNDYRSVSEQIVSKFGLMVQDAFGR